MKKIICELTAFFNYNFSFLFQNILEENSYKIQNQLSHDWLASGVVFNHGKCIKFYPQLFFLISYFLFQDILEEINYKNKNQLSHDWLASGVVFNHGKCIKFYPQLFFLISYFLFCFGGDSWGRIKNAKQP